MGPMAAGKSNLGLAIFDLVAHLTDNNCNKNIFYQNYLHAEGGHELAEFKFTFKFAGSVLEYQYGKSAVDVLHYEAMLIDGQTVARLTGNQPLVTALKGTETLNTDLSGSGLSANQIY